MSAEVQEAARQACQEVGIEYRPVPADGRFYETDIEGDRRGRGDGRIKLFADGKGGIAYNWKGEQRVFFSGESRRLTDAEQRLRDEAIRKAREAKARRRDEAVEKATSIWRAAQLASAAHPYLQRKQVAPTAMLREIDVGVAGGLLGYPPKSRGELLTGRLLVVPVAVGRALSTLELIDEHGRKAAIYGGGKAGGYWAVQPLPEDKGAGLTLLIGEGVATVLSAHQATGYPGVAALSCGNLPAVAKQMRARFPSATIVILADLGNGQPDAEAAAQSVGGLLALPDFGDDRPQHATDFNDVAVLHGLEAVARAVEAVRAPNDVSDPADGEARADVDADKNDWPAPQPLTAKFERESYPVDALPKMVRAAVEEVAAFVKAPLPLVASSALGALSLAIQAHVDIRRAERLQGPVGLFLLTIADSGERKSTCDNFFTSAIREHDAQQREVAAGPLRDYAAALAAWETKRAGIKDKLRQLAKDQKPTGEDEARLRDLEYDKPQPPRVPRLVYGDITPEALGYQVATGWPSAGIVSSEAGTVLGSHGMGSDSAMRNLALLNQLWDGAPISSDRRTSESWAARSGRLTVVLQVQEATLREFFGKSGTLARGTGFLARFLIAQPESTQGTRAFTEAPAAWPHLAAFNNRLAALLAQPVPIEQDGSLVPPVLVLAPDAKRAWVAYHDAIESGLAVGGELHDVRDVASKVADNAARLAALFEVFEQGISGTVSLDAFEAASRIVAWHLSEARRFLGELALPIELANAARLDTWLIQQCRRNATTTVRIKDIQQYGPGALRKKESLDAALRELEELDRAQVR